MLVDLIVIAIIALLMIRAVYVIIRDKKEHRGCCSGGCSGCSGTSGCPHCQGDK